MEFEIIEKSRKESEQSNKQSNKCRLNSKDDEFSRSRSQKTMSYDPNQDALSKSRNSYSAPDNDLNVSTISGN